MIQNIFADAASPMEKEASGCHKGVYKILAKYGAAAHCVFPDLMSDFLAKKVPKVVLLTTEFACMGGVRRTLEIYMSVMAYYWSMAVLRVFNTEHTSCIQG